MKKILLAGASTVALLAVAPANAADLGMKAPLLKAPAAAYYSWTGCYAGAHVGVGWGTKDVQNVSHGFVTSYGSGSVDETGMIFGGQLGCNYQFASNLVLGIEGSGSGASITGLNHGNDATLDVHTDSLASVTGRLGYNGWYDPSLLAYVKGGWAWRHEQTNASDYEGEDSTSAGWTVGGGLEWAFAKNWSTFVEYDYYKFNQDGNCYLYTSGSCENTAPNSIKINEAINTVKVGVNLHLNMFGMQ